MKHELAEAIALLDDKHLVWSEDFETIRLPLSDLLERLRQSESTEFDDELETLLHALLQIDYTDAVATDPLLQWLDSASRQLEIVEYAASRSERTAAAIKRLFRSI
jgi:hypothetical protein